MTAIACAGLLLVPLGVVWSAQAQENEGAPQAFDAPDGSTLREWRGRSVLRLAGACLAAQPCVGTNETDAGSFLLEAAGADGVIAVTWRPVNDSLTTLRVRVAGASVEGVPPLELRIDALSPGEYPVLIEPTRPVAGAWEQPVDWTARFRVSPLPEEMRAAGVTTLHVRAACALDLCDAATTERAGTFLLPWRAGEATLDATWDERAGPATIRVADATATGEPPLALDLAGLARDVHEVHVIPELALPGDFVVRWTLRATPAQG